MLFVDKLYQHFDLSYFVSKAATILDNFYIKPDNKIFAYNMDFIFYVF